MGYAAGTPGQTGVGSSQNATGQSQQPGFGGKGGGAGTPPQTLSQPGQSSSAPENKPAPVFGGNAFGYNMNRLAGRMDPSASLPPQQTQAPVQQAPAAQGGKGGGYGDLSQFPGAQEFLSQYGQQDQQQQPMYGQPPRYDQQDQQPMYGQQQQKQQPMYGQQAEQENPFAAKQSDYENQLADLKSQIAAIKSGQFNTLEDKGAEINPLGPGYDEYGYKTQEQAAEETQTAADEAAKKKAEIAAIPDYYTNKDYKYDTYADYADEDIANMSAKEVKSLYGSRLTTANADVKQATADYNAAMKSGDIKKANAAKANLDAQKAEAAKIKADQKARADAAAAKEKAAKAAAAQKKKDDAAAAKAAKTPAKAAKVKAAPVAKAAKVKAAPVARAAPVTKAVGTTAAKAAPSMGSIAAPKKTTKKKATGGVIHNGMSNNLKKMLGD